MIALPESWSRPAEPRRAALLAVLAGLLFAASWAALHRGFYARHQIVDTPVYELYGAAIAHGHVPYRDFGVEYPPGALPVFVLPALVSRRGLDASRYRRAFETLMWICGALVLAATAVALAGLRAPPVRQAAALALVALAPLALGSVVLSRFDLWPAAVVAAALAALLTGRLRLGSLLLGLGVAVKVYPAVLVPLAVAYAWRRRGRREALACLGLAAVALGVVVLPFLALSPGGVWAMVVRQGSRPLQIESLGSGLLLVAHRAYHLSIAMRSSHGSQNLAGTLPDALAALLSVLQVAALVAIWAWFARGEAGKERLVRASAAALTAFVALGKVLSPQFLVWLVPAIALVGGRRGRVAGAMIALALVLTQLWFPYRYWDLALHFDPVVSALVLLRDLVLVGLLVVLLWPGLDAEPAPEPAG